MSPNKELTIYAIQIDSCLKAFCIFFNSIYSLIKLQNHLTNAFNVYPKNPRHGKRPELLKYGIKFWGKNCGIQHLLISKILCSAF